MVRPKKVTNDLKINIPCAFGDSLSKHVQSFLLQNNN